MSSSAGEDGNSIQWSNDVSTLNPPKVQIIAPMRNARKTPMLMNISFINIEPVLYLCFIVSKIVAIYNPFTFPI